MAFSHWPLAISLLEELKIKNYFLILHFAFCILHFVSATAQTQTPLYIVNGVEMESVQHIPEQNIEYIDHLPANEATVAKYGDRANNGVIIVTLRYDKEAQFMGDKPLADYIAERVKWPENFGVARYVARYTIGADGSFRLGTELESTDHQLRKRVLKVLHNLPAWQPATKQGKAVDSEYVLRVQLPRGKAMPKEPYIVIR